VQQKPGGLSCKSLQNQANRQRFFAQSEASAAQSPMFFGSIFELIQPRRHRISRLDSAPPGFCCSPYLLLAFWLRTANSCFSERPRCFRKRYRVEAEMAVSFRLDDRANSRSSGISLGSSAQNIAGTTMAQIGCV